ncbi:hypothetical protein KCU89_g104, partial [Aureobasidium melanogenum]
MVWSGLCCVILLPMATDNLRGPTSHGTPTTDLLSTVHASPIRLAWASHFSSLLSTTRGLYQHHLVYIVYTRYL